MEEDEDDHHRRQRTSHSRRVMEAVSQITKPRCAVNLDRKRERRVKIYWKIILFPTTYSLIMFLDVVLECNKIYDAFHVLGLILEQKITASLRMLAYGASADQVDEIARMGKITVLESLIQFCSAIEAIYTNEYLRTPTPRDMRRLLRKAAQNNLNVLAQSPVFDELLQGKLPRCTYWVNGT
ncbi:unnamed protein product [Malus baccata var. baccata]